MRRFWLLAVSISLVGTPALLGLDAGALSSNKVSSTEVQGLESVRQNLHLLNRISFGPTAQDISKLESMGPEEYIRRQLNPDSIEELPEVTKFVRSCDALTSSPLDLYRHYGPPAIMAKSRSAGNNNGAANNNGGAGNGGGGNGGKGGGQGGNKNANDGVDPKQRAKMEARRELFSDIGQQTIQARLLRELESTRQLQEVMTDFWFNHFNVSIDKGLDHIWVGAYEEQAIRPYALGKFRDLLEATSHHPAMLFYLDNWENTAPGSPGARGNFTGINENFARELMELHTLGVDGGYTQKDVTELARILTGLGLPKPKGGGHQRWARPGFIGGPAGLASYGARSMWRAGSPYVKDYFAGLNIDRYGAVFDKDRHDFGDKVLLGHVIQGSGEKEIEEALDILAASPATAHHISYQLAQYFVSDNPPASLVNKLAATFTRTNGDIKVVMNELLHSREFWDPQYGNSKYKNPLRYAISSLRVANEYPDNFRPVQAFLNQQGMKMYGCLTPDGYKNTKEAWLNSGALLQRLSFATGVGLGKLPGNPDLLPAEYSQIASVLTGLELSDETRKAIEGARPMVKSTLLLGSPEFMSY